MRLFWIILATLVVVLAIWGASRRGGSTAPQAEPQWTRQGDPRPAAAEAPSTAAARPTAPSERDATASTASITSPPPDAPAPTTAALPTATLADAITPTPPPAPAAPADGESLPTGASLPIGLDREIPSATVIAGRIERTETGTLRADGRFELRGSGTREDPYEVPWEYLVSAGEHYRPRTGDRGIPQRIALLDGQWIRIAGYIAFPGLESTSTEALVMLNRWDGCCIGVPPSPYDAIEVKLDSPIARRGLHTIDYGAVVGRLSVEPYLIENWLVGLYLMDDAMVRLDL